MVCLCTVALIGIAIAGWIYMRKLRDWSPHGIVTSLKWWLAWFYLRRCRSAVQGPFVHHFDLASKNAQKLGIVPTDEEWRRERPRDLLPHIHASDAVEFAGVNHQGGALVVRLSRHHGRFARASIYLRLQDGVQYETTVHPDGRHHNVNPNAFHAGGLNIQVVEPLRHWRLVFRGALKKISQRDSSDDEKNEEVDVSFNFMWNPAYHQYVQSHDFNLQMAADSIVKESWNLEFLRSIQMDPDQRYDQWGQMRGQIRIAEEDNMDYKFWAPKIRTYGTLENQIADKFVNIHVHCEDGHVVSLRSSMVHGGLKNITHGYLVLSSNFGIDTISECDFDIATIFTENRSPDSLCLRFTADGKAYVLSLTLEEHSGFRVFRDDEWASESVTKMATGFLNDTKAYGIVEMVRPQASLGCGIHQQTSQPLLMDADVLSREADDLLVVSLEDPACRCCHLVGGKGASLALMMSAQTQNYQFDVPKGFSLTKNSFYRHLNDNEHLKDAIAKLEDVAWSRVVGHLPDECQETYDSIENSHLSTEMKLAIQEHLRSIFGDNYETLQFAVRSSAIGEDGVEMSAAGQNETVLGVIGNNNIFQAITKCWASQFAFRSVEYKRNNGQIINSGMGVVVQEMVDSDIAGVVFTSHPVSNNVGYIVITANYGLGDSVVSGISEPDTIVLKKLDDGLRLIIYDKDMGEKKIRLELGEKGGVVERKTSIEASEQLSMSEGEAISLGRVAVFLEKCYGGPRDIEYAIKDGRLFLLQCRPITTHLNETDYEMMHEFDSPLITDNERFTTANVGEVFPGASSSLTITCPIRMIQTTGQNMNSDKMDRYSLNPILSPGAIVYCNRLIVDKIYQKLFGLSKKISSMSLGVELGVHGRAIKDQELQELALKRFQIPGAWTGIKSLFNVVVKCMILGKRFLDAAKARYTNFSVPTQGVSSAEDLLARIETSLFDIDEVYTVHIKMSTTSILWNVTVLGMLKGSSSDYGLDQYNDFAALIGNANGSISGDVPSSLKELGAAIDNEINSTEFSNMDPETAIQWLETEAKEAGNKFREFLRRHGHRCYNEYDLSSISWGMDPIKLIEVLQVMLSVPISPSNIKEEESIKNILENLKSPLTPMTKRILAYILPICRNCMCHREQSKSLFVKVVHEIRVAFRLMGHMMVKEELLPDPDLIFYMTSSEIHSLLKTRSARTINRAVQRRKLIPKQNSLHFPEFIKGDPKADEEEDNNDSVDVVVSGTKLKAYPVSQGVAKGPARVILSFDQVNEIKPGDILITYITDIGWSPYFPMLAGVVTEMGGLVSHGAVVAREYGLPCVVAARGATKIFKSGDIVLLDANKGTLELVQET